ncbi:MAG: alpha/beta hydrolase [Limisphaerales bacterium]
MLDSLVIPPREPGPAWTMVVLHGLGDSLAGYRWLPDALDLPWLGYRLVNAPDHYFGGYSWYDFAGNPAPGVIRSRALLREFLAGLEAEGVPAERTFLLGFSQGCLMTLDVALRHPQRLAGAVGISGYVHEPEALLRELGPAAREQRLLVTHGSLDPLIPIASVRAQMGLLRGAGLRLEWREFRKEHTIAGEEELAVIREFLAAGRTGALPGTTEPVGKLGSG